MSHKINATQIDAGEDILLDGEIHFTRISKLVDGEELNKEDERRRSRGMNPIGRPHTSATIRNARVRPKDPSGQLSITEQFVAERIYQPKPGADGTMPTTKDHYSIDNKSTILPGVGKLSGTVAGQYEPVALEGEPAPGTQVTLHLRSFQPKGYANKGIGLQNVLINQTEFDYYAGAGAGQLANLGITFSGPLSQPQGQVGGEQDQAPTSPAQPQGTPQGQQGQQDAPAAPAAPASGYPANPYGGTHAQPQAGQQGGFQQQAPGGFPSAPAPQAPQGASAFTGTPVAPNPQVPQVPQAQQGQQTQQGQDPFAPQGYQQFPNGGGVTYNG